jgi:hypothetical protein
MPKSIHRVTTVVRAVEPVSEGVLAFELADPDDWELPRSRRARISTCTCRTGR